MRLSICIPQYNRIDFLLKNLSILEQQTYSDLEVVVSDDCSTDNTEEAITALVPKYKHKLIYNRFNTNQGYDRNFRKCIELATGDYVIVIGNDDTINPSYDLNTLANFLTSNNYPELGFANFIEESSGNTLIERAKRTDVLGTGYETAMRYYSCFSFVGGLIYKKDYFNRHNSNKHDGSIYAQIYLGCLMTSKGARLFSIKEPVVIKDIVLEQQERNSYRDVIARKWKDYKVETGGLPSVMNVLIDAFRDAGVLTQPRIYAIFKRVYTVTFPFWIVDYKSNGALPAAVGLVQGLMPSRNENTRLLNFTNRAKVWCWYFVSSTAGLLTPVAVFKKLKHWLYNKLKR